MRLYSNMDNTAPILHFYLSFDKNNKHHVQSVILGIDGYVTFFL